jgi:hypothetical protein
MITPITGDYTVGKGLVFFQAQGSAVWEEIGDVDNLDVTVEVEELERRSNQYGVAMLAHSAVTQVGGTVEMTAMQMTDRNRALGMAGDRETMSQTAETAQTMTVTGVAAGGIYMLPALSVSNVSVDDGEATATSYTLGTHYELDAEAGMLKVLSLPEGSGADMVVTYDTAEISSGLQVGIGGNPNQRGALRFRGVNDIGVRVLVDLWDVQLRPSGARSYISSEYASVPLTGKIFAVPGKARGYAMGMERTL